MSKILWQTKAMDQQIERLRPSYLEELEPIDPENAQDITGTQDADKLIHKYFPDIKITGFALLAERLRSWGGVYYRILQKRNTQSESPNERCLQWLYVWTTQKFFFSFWETIIPPFIFAMLSLLFFNNFYEPTFSFWDYFARNDLLIALSSLLFVGAYFVLQGLYRIGFALIQRQKGKVYFHNSMLLLPIGTIYLYYLYNPAIWGSLTLRNESWHKVLKLLFVWHPTLNETIDFLIPMGAILLLGVMVSLGIIWVIQGLPVFKMHDMDWAPLFIYLKQNDSQEWEFDKMIYDSYHYYTDIKTKAEVEARASVNALFNPAISELKLEIPNFWHSFELFNEKSRRTFIVTASAIAFFSLVGSLILRIYNINSAVGLLTFVLFLIGVFITYSKRSSKLISYEKRDKTVYVKLRSKPDIQPELEESSQRKISERIIGLIRRKPLRLSLSNIVFHLTPQRLNLFWQLKKEDAVLQIRTKLKNPFISDFETFRD